ncbi:MAG: cytochrome P450 [Actinobacteria bacterium]|nr:cytochrome P450 [Actinomycetota bacterium]
MPAHFLGTPATAPGPLGPDMLQSFNLIRCDPLEFLFANWRKYGDVVQFPLPRPPTYLVNSPTGVRQGLVGNAKNYSKATIQYRALSLVTGSGLLTANTDLWRERRPIIQPAFHQEAMDNLIPVSQQAADRMAAELDSNGAGVVTDVDQFMLSAALEVVGEFLFGSDLSADAQLITEATLQALEVVIKRARVPLSPPRKIPTPGNRVLKRSLDTLDSAVASIVESRTGAQSLGVTASGVNLVDLLLAASANEQIDLEGIRDEVVTFIIAGHETVASALSWSVALLATHPQVQERVAAEVRAARGETLDSKLAQLPYTQAVFSETLRLYPPAWLITRKALGPDCIDGHDIPAGALVITSPALLHRHPEIWSDPDSFNPERFLVPFPRESFIPFGAGLRQCIGKDFAYVEGLIMLASLCERLKFEYPTGGILPASDPLVTIRPVGGVKVLASRRV